jgi:hypothetical protein
MILIGGGVSHHQLLHNYCHESPNRAYRGENVYMLKGSSSLCCGFLHLIPMSMFGIVNSFLGVGKFVRVCAFKLCHRVNISLCDDLL